jgi:Na+-transporting methylmalonyl-CoA/oxaloacetate decarboxylase gamma subunit
MVNLGTSLWITLIGMGIVFLAIILLWGLMVLLVRVTRDKPVSISETDKYNLDLKAKAAAVAVVVALATSKTSSYQGEFQPPSDTVSAWQSANRTNQA